MIYRSAEINAEGIADVLLFADNPRRIFPLDEEPFDENVVPSYISGISVPDIEGLKLPFCVPIEGDNESVSLRIDWPRKGELDIFRRITFTGMLPAEEVVYEPLSPTTVLSGDLDVRTDDEYDLEEGKAIAQERLDQAFDDFIGEWGGFLRVVVEVREVEVDGKAKEKASGLAWFYLIEGESEYETVHDLLNTGLLGADEIVSNGIRGDATLAPSIKMLLMPRLAN